MHFAEGFAIAQRQHRHGVDAKQGHVSAGFCCQTVAIERSTLVKAITAQLDIKALWDFVGDVFGSNAIRKRI